MTSIENLSYKKLLTLLTAVAFSTAMVGCNQTPAVSQNESVDTNSTVGSEQEKQTQTVSATSTNDTSPAADANRLPAKTAGPGEVCEKFLSFIRTGNTSTAEQLLTSLAYTNTSRAGLELEPLGGKDSTFKVGDVMYVTTKQRQAHVQCTISEPGVHDINVVWTMKKLGIGWRVSGVILENEKGAQDFLSFENPADVAQIKGPEPQLEKSTSVAVGSLTTARVIIQEEPETIALASFDEPIEDHQEDEEQEADSEDEVDKLDATETEANKSTERADSSK